MFFLLLYHIICIHRKLCRLAKVLYLTYWHFMLMNSNLPTVTLHLCTGSPPPLFGYFNLGLSLTDHHPQLTPCRYDKLHGYYYSNSVYSFHLINFPGFIIVVTLLVSVHLCNIIFELIYFKGCCHSSLHDIFPPSLLFHSWSFSDWPPPQLLNHAVLTWPKSHNFFFQFQSFVLTLISVILPNRFFQLKWFTIFLICEIIIFH